ncbi:angiopoietin-related protein 3-like [Betta splendens]|uniref:Angiopoietin-related protein 3-like n=1 Tax=Betta splendens TaxID=158456 RepID=A0A6P7L3M9_BETSP|nr:angiopoietin-related protein 3-like [Betta splendens]
MRTLLFPALLLLAAAGVPALCGEEAPPVLRLEAPAEVRSRFAALDDVHLLANGLLQLGQSLREFVQKTRGQIDDIFHKLNIFDRTFYRLSVLTSEIKEEEEELKKTAVILKASNDEIKDLSVGIGARMNGILREKSELRSKVESLEQKLSSLSQGAMTSEQVAQISTLRDVIHSQEQSIIELLKAVSAQSDQIDNQRTKIKNLEEKLTASSAAQETIDRAPEAVSSEAPTLAPYVTSGSTNTTAAASPASDCSQLFSAGERVSGVYAIRPNGSEPFMAFCDMSKDYGATVIQRRRDGSVNFDQTWDKYENGFGDLQGDVWLGLRKLHSLAAQGNAVLQIRLEDWKQAGRSLQYGFHLDGAERNYTIHLTHLSGDVPDPLINHTGMMFSTKDRDNDRLQSSSCAHLHAGGWWFNACGDASLNGRYVHLRPKGRRRGIQWKLGRKSSNPLKLTQMSVLHPRPPSPTPPSPPAGTFH